MMHYCARHDLAFCAEHKGLCFEDCSLSTDTRAEFCSVCVGLYRPSTSSRLGKVLKDEGLSRAVVDLAYAGRYDDFRSNSATPINDLVHELRILGRRDLAERAINGEWDGTLEEGNEWFEREGRHLLSELSEESAL